MSVSAVSGSNANTVTQLEKQLQNDEKTLAADEKAGAPQTTLTLDEARVTADSAAIAQAQALTQAQAPAALPTDSTVVRYA